MKHRFFILLAPILALALVAGCGGINTYNPSVIGGASRLIFAGHGYSDDVDVINLESMTILATITGAGGYRMVLSTDGRTLYSTGGGGLISVSNAETFTLTSSIDPTVAFPSIAADELEAIAINPAGTRVYVFDEQGDTALFVIDTATNTVLSAVSLALDEPENAIVSPDGAFVYVVDNSVIAKISTTSLAIVATVPVGSDAHGIALNSAGTQVYAKGDDGIDAFDAVTLAFVTNIVCGSDGYYIDNRPGSSRLYAVNEGSTLSVINSATNTLVSDVTLSLSSARGVFAAPGGSPVVVATSGGLVQVDASSLAELSTLSGSYQSILIK